MRSKNSHSRGLRSSQRVSRTLGTTSSVKSSKVNCSLSQSQITSRTFLLSASVLGRSPISLRHSASSEWSSVWLESPSYFEKACQSCDAQLFSKWSMALLDRWRPAAVLRRGVKSCEPKDDLPSLPGLVRYFRRSDWTPGESVGSMAKPTLCPTLSLISASWTVGDSRICTSNVGEFSSIAEPSSAALKAATTLIFARAFRRKVLSRICSGRRGRIGDSLTVCAALSSSEASGRGSAPSGPDGSSCASSPCGVVSLLPSVALAVSTPLRFHWSCWTCCCRLWDSRHRAALLRSRSWAALWQSRRCSRNRSTSRSWLASDTSNSLRQRMPLPRTSRPCSVSTTESRWPPRCSTEPPRQSLPTA
mmetsp:Transcript_60805/g.171349  ORF Transcript_60805/g.171349 Transcript_60805/m.171349 type:complete len:362 (-) Transcript_60805:84-1169(-)